MDSKEPRVCPECETTFTDWGILVEKSGDANIYVARRVCSWFCVHTFAMDKAAEMHKPLSTTRK